MFRRLIVIVLLLSMFYPPGVGMAAPDKEKPAPAMVKAIRIGNSTDQFRIVVDMDKEVDYDIMTLSNPGRVVVNLHNARIGVDVKREILLDSRFASKIRVGQFDKETVRIVVETEAGKGGYDVFSLEGGASPYRVVIDIGRLGSKEKQTQNMPADADKNKQTVPTDDNGQRETQVTTNKKEMPLDKGSSGEEKVEQDTADDVDSIEEDALILSKKLKKKTIAIDPGHGGEDPGAIGPTGVTEKSITLNIAKELQRILEESGAKVIMTRTKDTEVSAKHRQANDIDELQARCDVANKAGADIFISVHMDSFSNRKASGTTGYYYEKGSTASRKLAAHIQSSVINQIKTESRGVKSCNFYVVKHTKMPATLIEVAFVSNPKEEKLLASARGVRLAAIGIARGISAFFDE